MACSARSVPSARTPFAWHATGLYELPRVGNGCCVCTSEGRRHMHGRGTGAVAASVQRSRPAGRRPWPAGRWRRATKPAMDGFPNGVHGRVRSSERKPATRCAPSASAVCKTAERLQLGVSKNVQLRGLVHAGMSGAARQNRLHHAIRLTRCRAASPPICGELARLGCNPCANPF